MTNDATLKVWAVMLEWFVGFTTSGGGIDSVESRGRIKSGRGGDFSPFRFNLGNLLVDRFVNRWHK